MNTRRTAASCLFGAALFCGVAAQEQRPTVRSGVELLLVDAQVIDGDGQPVLALTSKDFEVTLDGKRREVVSVQLLQFGTKPVAAAAPPPPTPQSLQTLPLAPGGRRFILAIDEHSFAAAAAPAAMQAARRFIDRLEPHDLVGLYTYPTGAAHSDLTTDHESVRRLLGKVAGLLQPPISQYRLSKSEITDIASGDTEVLHRVAERECGPPGTSCRRPIQVEATSLAGYLEMQITQSLNGLRGLISALAPIEGRKTLILISGGLFTSDRGSGRVDMGSEIRELGRQAARSNVTVYALHMDSSFLDAFSGGRLNLSTLFRDTNALAAGLEQVAGAAGGAVIRVQGGTGDYAFDRVLRENSAYYLLGVRVEPSDRDGDVHQVRVRVRGRGMTVRSRSTALVPKGT